ncbi:PAS domain-containing sensor histidine kinase [Kriegella aquimaris]|uniref:histidine kinase n=1 Tax=Kriegella aquimaris TaxID=192904 RepID=A0A1G9NN16_9FLAO|nr:PAS domain-containing sensor histidine kinase [Kriegella aquimaris]SDL87437.1 PAS/PAC sensor signal transduction histidine kinase [Kriegella aquimaris]
MKNKPIRQETEKSIPQLKKQNKMPRSSSLQGFDEERAAQYTHTILNNMGDSVFVKDDQSRLLLVNDAFCEIFGLPRSEIIGRTLAEQVSPEERESFLKIDGQVLEDGIENINEETLTVGNQTRIISTRKSRFIDGNGNKFLVGVIRDITAHKKTRKDLEESEAKFKELNATKDKLFSIIGHDLRNPFNNILVLSELLTDSLKMVDPTTCKQYIELINSTAKNTLLLLENLMGWAQTQTGQIQYYSEKINLSNTIEEIVKLSNSIAATKKISLNHVESETIEIYSDEKLLKTVLRNLISNAIKFTHPGGNIDIILASQPNQIEICISDNGVGMDEETSNKLFTANTKSTSKGTANEKGTGFGLILCKEFVEKLGGTIWVESELDKGSNFKFTLPLKKNDK